MKIRAALIAATFALLSSTQVRAEDTAKKTEKVCQDISSLDSALANFKSLNPNATVKEAKMAEERVSKAVEQLGKSAKSARPEQYKALKEAHKDMQKAVKDAPEDATLGQVQANISSSRERVQTAYDDLKQSITCPSSQMTP
jgi:hypothetical protein